MTSRVGQRATSASDGSDSRFGARCRPQGCAAARAGVEARRVPARPGRVCLRETASRREQRASSCAAEADSSLNQRPISLPNVRGCRGPQRCVSEEEESAAGAATAQQRDGRTGQQDEMGCGSEAKRRPTGGKHAPRQASQSTRGHKPAAAGGGEVGGGGCGFGSDSRTAAAAGAIVGRRGRGCEMLRLFEGGGKESAVNGGWWMARPPPRRGQARRSQPRADGHESGGRLGVSWRRSAGRARRYLARTRRTRRHARYLSSVLHVRRALRPGATAARAAAASPRARTLCVCAVRRPTGTPGRAPCGAGQPRAVPCPCRLIAGWRVAVWLLAGWRCWPPAEAPESPPPWSGGD